MKARVKTYLNERTQKPSVNAPNYHYYSPGDEIEIVDIVNGDNYDGIDVWYKLDNDSFVWSGGVEGVQKIETQRSEISSEIQEQLVNFNSSFKKLDNTYKSTEGSGIKIAVLDTGIYENHPDFEGYFNNPYKPSQDFTKSDFNYVDRNGHGTHVAGIIGARSKDSDGIIGVSPNSEIWNLKCQSDTGEITSKTLSPAFEEILEKKPHIVNMSFNLTKDDFNSLESKIKEIADAGIILIGAAGENRNLTKYSLYPAFSEHVISVGSIDKDFNLNSGESFHSSLDFIIPLIKMKSCNLKRFGFYKYESGSSMATALVSGLVALIISKTAKKSLVDIKEELTKFSYRYSNTLTLNEIKLITP